MRDYITIGSSPSGVNCASFGDDNYHSRSRIECRAFINQITRVMGRPPKNAKLGIKTFAHDFGNYVEVVCFYDTNDEVATKYAFDVESSEALEYWDDIAVDELKQLGFDAFA